jgi:hypothetical protein
MPSPLGQVGTSPCDLDRDRSNAACAPDDEDGAAVIGGPNLVVYAQAVEQPLTRADRGQRQRGGFGWAQASGPTTNVALVHQLVFGVATVADDGSMSARKPPDRDRLAIGRYV